MQPQLATRLSRLTLAFVVLARSLPAAAQQPPTSHLFIAYDEQQSDASRVRLIDDLLKLMPPSRWSPAPTQPDDAWETIIKRYFGYYPAADPKTVERLKQAITEVNGKNLAQLKKQGFVSLPPLPRRGYEKYGFPNSPVRFYNATNKEWSVAASFETLPTARKVSAVKAGNITALEIDVPSEIVADIVAKQQSVFAAASVFSHPEGAPVRFFETAAKCDSLLIAVENSPYKTRAIERFANLNTAEKAAFAKRSEERLRIIDWDFQGGHGAKVVSAAMSLLSSMSLQYLATKIDSIELNPRIYDKYVSESVDQYADMLKRQKGKKATNDRDKNEAEKWIRTYQPTSDNEQHINEFVLRSVLWRYLSEEPSFANFSFSMLSDGLKIEFKNLIGSMSFASVAAGNTMDDLDPDSVPQTMAATWPSLINTTYGTSDGTVLGAHTGDNFATKVSLLAPGCGFNFGVLKTDEEGSSLASPFVAVAGWLKYLRDGTNGPELRRALLLATHVTPDSPAVESGGTFDPYLLLSGLTRHALLSDRTVIPYHHGELTLQYVSGGGTEKFSPEHLRGDFTQTTLNFYQCGVSRCAKWRHAHLKDAELDEMTKYVVKQFSLRLYDAQSHVLFDSTAAGAPSVVDLWF